MRKYETVFVIRPDLEEEQTAGVIEKFTGIITNNGGEITNIDKKKKKRLAYEINHVKEGYYVLVNFDGEPATIKELERAYKSSDEIIHHIIGRLE
ncbi:MAG: 30S ribosomal protein S6, partial [Clostridia bacterium]|nr:30S ribosomal protein S6 [Clostridia bacterium]